jgi:Protein of unknown function (DUF3617)
MRRKPLACLAPAAALLALGTGAAPVPVLEPGNWMYSLEVVSNGKQMPARTAEECLDEELKDVVGYFAPQLEGVQGKCENERKSADSHLDYKMRCVGSGFVMEAVTRVTIEDSRHVRIRTQVLTQTMQGDTRVVMSGDALRTGACRKKR